MTEAQHKQALNLLSQLEDAKHHNELDQFIIDQHDDLHRLLSELIWVKPSTAGAA